VASPTNETIRGIHVLLVKRVDTLSTQLGGTTDPSVAQGIVLEMEELVHRINLLQKVMFAGASAQLDLLVPAVEEADAELADALEDVEKIALFIKAAAKLLAKVDKVVDLAKTLVPA